MISLLQRSQELARGQGHAMQPNLPVACIAAIMSLDCSKQVTCACRQADRKREWLSKV